MIWASTGVFWALASVTATVMLATGPEDLEDLEDADWAVVAVLVVLASPYLLLLSWKDTD